MKKIILALFLISYTTFADADITTGLVGWWKFDEGSGTTTADSSGNGNTGTLVNSPAWVAGKRGPYALSFNGNNSYVISSSFGTPPQSETLSVWIKSGSAGGVVLDELGQTTLNSTWHDSQIEVETNGTVKTCVWTGSVSCVNATTGLNYSQWHHIALTYNVSTHTLTGYYDGISSASSTVTRLYWSSLYYAVGSTDSTNAGNGNYFNGTVDDVHIYNRALSSSDVYQLFASGSVVLHHTHLAHFHIGN